MDALISLSVIIQPVDITQDDDIISVPLLGCSGPSEPLSSGGVLSLCSDSSLVMEMAITGIVYCRLMWLQKEKFTGSAKVGDCRLKESARLSVC